MSFNPRTHEGQGTTNFNGLSNFCSGGFAIRLVLAADL